MPFHTPARLIAAALLAGAASSAAQAEPTPDAAAAHAFLADTAPRNTEVRIIVDGVAQPSAGRVASWSGGDCLSQVRTGEKLWVIDWRRVLELGHNPLDRGIKVFGPVRDQLSGLTVQGVYISTTPTSLADREAHALQVIKAACPSRGAF